MVKRRASAVSIIGGAEGGSGMSSMSRAEGSSDGMSGWGGTEGSSDSGGGEGGGVAISLLARGKFFFVEFL